MNELNSKQLEAAKMVYIAWDLPELNQRAIDVFEATKGYLFNVKINSIYKKQGPRIVKKLKKEFGIENILLDMKFKDISGTVKKHAYSAVTLDLGDIQDNLQYGVDAFTIYADGGVPMMKEAMQE